MSINGIYSVRVFYADSEYMLDVLNGPILAEKSRFLIKFTKSEKIPSHPNKKNIFFT
jgi:hypothetical protein